MNFEVLENFEWYNEPENVRFDENSMMIYAKSSTDFLQQLHKGVRKDNGHLFFCRKDGDFDFILKWKFDSIKESTQCGVMVRVDERNWFKSAIEKSKNGTLNLFSSLTILGHSDWTATYFDSDVDEIWFRVVRTNDEYEVFYSIDGVSFFKYKEFYLEKYEEVKVGAYITSSERENVVAELSDIRMLDI
jgi:regulation of enolase protein 1 (concanavalin A-like superfamily)